MLNDLQNNEVILLMYLSGELPAEDQKEVAEMLRVDAGMRSEFARIEAAQSALSEKLSALDRAEPVTPVESAVRRIGKAMRQRQVEILAEVARKRKPTSHRVMPTWAYPSIAAAAVLAAFLVWVIRYNLTGVQLNSPDLNSNAPSNELAFNNPAPPVPNVPPVNAAPVPPPAIATADTLADDLKNSFASSDADDAQVLALKDDPQVSVGSGVNE